MAQQTWPQQKATQGNGQSAICCCEWDAAAGPRDHSHLTIEQSSWKTRVVLFQVLKIKRLKFAFSLTKFPDTRVTRSDVTDIWSYRTVSSPYNLLPSLIELRRKLDIEISNIAFLMLSFPNNTQPPVHKLAISVVAFVNDVSGSQFLQI